MCPFLTSLLLLERRHPPSLLDLILTAMALLLLLPPPPPPPLNSTASRSVVVEARRSSSSLKRRINNSRPPPINPGHVHCHSESASVSWKIPMMKSYQPTSSSKTKSSYVVVKAKAPAADGKKRTMVRHNVRDDGDRITCKCSKSKCLKVSYWQHIDTDSHIHAIHTN